MTVMACIFIANIGASPPVISYDSVIHSSFVSNIIDLDWAAGVIELGLTVNVWAAGVIDLD